MSNFIYSQIAVTISNPSNATPALNASYSSFGDALTAVNAITAMSGPIVLTCASASETAPVKGFVIGSATLNPVLNATNTITITKSSGIVTLNAGVGTSNGSSLQHDGILYLNGADYITIDGLSFIDNNSTSDTVAMEFGIAFFKRSTNDGCNFNTIKNCTFEMQRINKAKSVSTNGTNSISFDGAVAISTFNTLSTNVYSSLVPTNGGTLSTNGTNSNNKFFNNIILGGNYGIVLRGTFAGNNPNYYSSSFIGDINNDIGGTTNLTGNTILNFGGNNNGPFFGQSCGISIIRQFRSNVSNNIINNNDGGGFIHKGGLTGIKSNFDALGKTTINNNNITLQSEDNLDFIISLSGDSININFNSLSGVNSNGWLNVIRHQWSTGYINIHNNTISNITSTNNSTNGAAYIQVITGGKSVKNNSISNILLTGSLGGYIYVIEGDTVSGNTISNISRTNINNDPISASLEFIDGITTILSDGYVFDNNINGITHNYQPIFNVDTEVIGIKNACGKVYDNVIENLAVLRKPLSELKKCWTVGVLNPLCSFATDTSHIYNNTIHDFSSQPAKIYGIWSSGNQYEVGNLVNISSNKIYGLTSLDEVVAVFQTGGNPIIQKNKIYDIQSVLISGILLRAISGYSFAKIYNNLLSNFNPIPNTNSNIIGLNIQNNSIYCPNPSNPTSCSYLNSFIYILHNTIFLNATNHATNLNTTALFIKTPFIDKDVSNLTLQNNIFINNTLPSGTGKSIVYHRNGLALENYDINSNRNLFYVNNPGPNNLIFYDGTNSDQTLGGFQARVSPRENNSVSENTAFISTIGSNSGFLHIDPSINTLVEGKGVQNSEVLNDFDGDLRSPTMPDIGADEGDFLPMTPLCTALSVPLSNATSVPVSTNISWLSITNASGYYISIGTTPLGFEILNQTDVGNVLTYNPTIDLPYSSKIYVKITPYNIFGSALGCSTFSFTTELTIPLCSILTSPMNNAKNVPISANIVWSSASVATGYKLKIGTTISGGEILNNVDVGNVLSYDPLNDFPNFKTIYIKITPYNAFGDQISCQIDSFTTIPAPISVIVTGQTNTTPHLNINYPSLSSALSAVNAITGMSGHVTLTCIGDIEVTPSKGLFIGSSTLNPLLSDSTTIKINKGSGAGILKAGVGTSNGPSATPDGIFYINGADYITVEGITFIDENNTNPTEAMEFGVALFKRASNDGCNYNTIKDCTIKVQNLNNKSGMLPLSEGSVGIGSYNSTINAATTELTPTNGGTLTTNGTNSNNKFYSNTIIGGNYGLYFCGFFVPNPVPFPNPNSYLGDLNNDIGGNNTTTGNHVLNFGGGGTTTINPSAGIRILRQWNANISYNEINNNNGTNTNHKGELRGILAQAANQGNIDINYNTVTIKGGGTTAKVTIIENAIGGIGGQPPFGHTININGNIITGNYITATSGEFNVIHNNNAPATVVNINDNLISNLAYSAFPKEGSGISNIIFMEGNHNASVQNINGNQISNFSSFGMASSPIYIINAFAATANGNTISGVTDHKFTGGSSITVINASNCNYNVINNISVLRSGHIRVVTGNGNVSNNEIFNISNDGRDDDSDIVGIYNESSSGITSHNKVYNFRGKNDEIIGIKSSGNIFNNKIYDLQENGTGKYSTNKVYGLDCFSSQQSIQNIYNNYIGDLKAPNVSRISVEPYIMGIYNHGSTANFISNTIYINPSSSGNLSSAAFYSLLHNFSLRNNIIVNNSGTSGTQRAVAFQKASPLITGYNLNSNGNLFYAGIPSSTKLIYFDGTNSDTSITQFKTRVYPRDTISISEYPNFLSLVGGNSNYLHIDGSLPNLIESGGVGGTGITSDYDGDPRSNIPDIGADEFGCFQIEYLCNNLDDNCNGLIDEGVQNTYYKDADNDSFGDPNLTIMACSAPATYVTNNLDCNDNNASINPNAVEIPCNMVDDNCNGVIDENVLSTGLVAWYPFNNNAIDESPNINNGIVTNAVLTTDKNGIPNKAYEFNGTNARINVPNNANMNFANSTISAWIQYNSIPSGSLIGMITKRFNGNSTYYIYWDAGRIKVFTSDGSSSSTIVDNITAYPTAPTWLHVAYTFDDVNNTQKLYVNGIMVASAAANYSLAYNTNPVVFGANLTTSDTHTNFYTGKIDDVRFYNFVATPAQITHIMNDALPEICNGIDDDCDGMVDEGVQTTYYQDSDGDTFGDPTMTTLSCTLPANYVTNNLDCNDNNASINPNVVEIPCNMVDDNCNGVVDETTLLVGLNAWYPFNGNAEDESPNSNNGTVTNAVLTNDKNGVANKAYEFNGTNARIDVPNNANMNFANTTISAWIQYNSIPSGSLIGMITKRFNGNSTYYIYWDAGRIKVFTSDGSSSSTIVDNITAYPTAPTWLHVAYTFDDVNNTQKLYVNGIMVASAAANYSLAYNTNPVVFGANYTTSGTYNNFYTGKIDDVRFYNFVATPAQITHIMNDALPEICNGIDDDCDGMVDEGVQTTYYQDSDGDTFGNPTMSQLACSQPANYVPNNLDCNDNNASIHPNAAEIFCNTIDDNCNGPADETMLTSGLTAWYPFNGNATDESPNTNDGTVTNAVLTTDKNGVANKAYEFNGTNARIDIVNNANMNHVNLTISAWVQYNTLPTGTSLRGLVTKQFNGNSSHYLYWQNGKINAYSSNGTTSSTLVDNTTVYPTGPAWIHAAFTFDDVNNVNKLYVNGVNVATGSPTYSIAYNTYPVVIGAGYTGSVYNNYYTGKIDDVRIYNYASTANQVLHIMNDAPPEVCNGVDDDCDGMVDEGLIQTNTFTSVGGNLNWSNAPNWSQGIPTPCHDVVINSGQTVLVDIINAKARSVLIHSNGALSVQNNNVLEVVYGNGQYHVKNMGTLDVLGILKLLKMI